MAILPYHLALNYLVYIVCVKLNLIKKGDYMPLWLMFASNAVDIDHFFRLFSGQSINEQIYGLDNLAFHGWWCVLPISILSTIKKYRWFAIGWALHIILDGAMVALGLNYLLMPR